jgi:hypothetical protein
LTCYHNGRTQIEGLRAGCWGEYLDLRRRKVIGVSRKFHSGELHNLFSLPSVIRFIKRKRARWIGIVMCIEEIRNAYRILVRKPEGHGSLGRYSHKWEDETKLNGTEIGFKDVN